VTTALYRRYRPDTFEDVIGQDHVTVPLRTALSKNRVNHAYLFSGPRGCGKTTSARILARCLNCEQGPTPTPCGECDSCRDLSTGGPGSLDVIEIDAASHGGVDDARDLRERATFAPARDRYKIFIIDEAHMVTSAGFNALLKIVEEPPEHIKFIFATTEPEKVIGTIRSRTHHYPFRLIPPEPMIAYTQKLADEEHVSVAPGVMPLVVRAGGGSARDTLSVLDQLMAGAGPEGISYDLAVSLLGYTHAELLDDVVDALAAADAATVFGAVDRVVQSGLDPRRFVEDLLERFRDLIVVRAVPENADQVLHGVPADQLERMATQAATLAPSELSRWGDVTNTALSEMTGATSPRLHLELLCARLLLPSSDHTERGLAARVDRLERHLRFGGAAVEAGESASSVPDAAGQGPAVASPQVPGRDGSASAAGNGPSWGGPSGAAAAREALRAAQGKPDEAPAPQTPTQAPAAAASPQASVPDSAAASQAAPTPGEQSAQPPAQQPTQPSEEKTAAAWTAPAPAAPAASAAQAAAERPTQSQAPAAQEPATDPQTTSAGGPERASAATPEQAEEPEPERSGSPLSSFEPTAEELADAEDDFDEDFLEEDGEDESTPAETPAAAPAPTGAPQPGAARSQPAPGPSAPTPDNAAPASAAPAGDSAPQTNTAQGAPAPADAQQGRPTGPGQVPHPQGGSGSVEMFRRAWPDVMDHLKDSRRFVWSMVNPHVSIAGYDGRTLTLAFANPGPMAAFRSRPDAVGLVRSSIQAVLGVDPEIDVAAGGSGPDRGESGPKADGRLTPATSATQTPQDQAPATPEATPVRPEQVATPAPAVPAPAESDSADHEQPAAPAPVSASASTDAASDGTADSQEQAAEPAAASSAAPQPSAPGQTAETPSTPQSAEPAATPAPAAARREIDPSLIVDREEPWDDEADGPAPEDPWAASAPRRSAPASSSPRSATPSQAPSTDRPGAPAPQKSAADATPPAPVPTASAAAPVAPAPTSRPASQSDEPPAAPLPRSRTAATPPSPTPTTPSEAPAAPRPSADPSEPPVATPPGRSTGWATPPNGGWAPPVPGQAPGATATQAAPAPEAPSPGNAASGSAPGGRQSKYQQLMAQAKRSAPQGWGAPSANTPAQRQPGPVESDPEEFVPSDDDEELENSTTFGRQALERLLDATLIEELDHNGHPLAPRN